MGDTAYLIERGRVTVTKELHGHPIVLGLLGVGEIFGEMSLIDEAPRSATVTAMEETVVREIQREALFQSVHSDPNMALHLLRRLFARLREACIAVLQYPFVDRLYGELLERGIHYSHRVIQASLPTPKSTCIISCGIRTCGPSPPPSWRPWPAWMAQ